MLPLASQLLGETLGGVFHLGKDDNERFAILLEPV
jgi:hypothetical protein